jgi:hypothetical protein
MFANSMSINETVKKTVKRLQNNSQINSFELLFFAVQNPSAWWRSECPKREKLALVLKVKTFL